MQTSSFIINKIVAFFSLLNKYFEYSAIYALCSAINRAGKSSKAVNWFSRAFLEAPKRNYYEGSFVLKFFVLIFSFIMINLKVLFNFLDKHNKSSVNKKIFDYFVNRLKSPAMVVKAVAAVIGGAFAIKATIASLFDSGFPMFSIYMSLSVLFFIMAISNTEFWVRAVKGCFPYKFIVWFFDNE